MVKKKIRIDAMGKNIIIDNPNNINIQFKDKGEKFNFDLKIEPVKLKRLKRAFTGV